MKYVTSCALAFACFATAGLAQSSHTINVGELSDTNGDNILETGGSGFPLQTLGPTLTYTTPPGVIDAASAYTVRFEPFVTAVGTSLAPFTAPVESTGLPFPFRGLIDQFGDFIPNVELYLFDGAFENPGGALPTDTFVRTFDVSGAGPFPVFTYTYTVTVNADRSITITFQDVNLSFLGPLTIVNSPSNFMGIPLPGFIPLTGIGNVFFGDSTMRISVATPPVDIDTQTEFRFDGDLTAAYGPAEIRYLDDPAFADQPGPEDGDPVLQNSLSQTIESPQYGFTEAQSAIGTTTSFGLSDIDGQAAGVFQVSAPRIDPGSSYQNDRQIGLSVSPLSGADNAFSSQRVDRWTMVWDIYVPAASWASQRPASFLNFQSDNGTNSSQMGSADFFIGSLTGVGGGPIGIGINRNRVNGTLFDAASIVGSDFGPDRWMRIAIVCDNDFAREARIFVNGTKVGQLGWGDDIDNFLDPAAPDWWAENFDNVDPFTFFSTPIDTPSFVSWGSYPNPWLDFVTNSFTSVQGPATESAFVMFGDALGRGELFYVANYYFAESVINDADIAALGGPSADGIVLFCPLDLNTDGTVDDTEVAAFLIDLGVQSDDANVNRDSVSDAFDLGEAFDSLLENGC
ncbi:MAG: hypothetical protein AAGI30_00095 [Planctomycetota bacterium]